MKETVLQDLKKKKKKKEFEQIYSLHNVKKAWENFLMSRKIYATSSCHSKCNLIPSLHLMSYANLHHTLFFIPQVHLANCNK